MESQVIEKIRVPKREKTLPKSKPYYPFTTIRGRHISTKVVGVTFDGRQEVVAKLQRFDQIWLEQEPENPYDKNAIKVCRSNGEQIGYLNRHLAAGIGSYFRVYNYPVQGRVVMLTGGEFDGYSLGVIVEFKIPIPQHPSKKRETPTFDDWDAWYD